MSKQCRFFLLPSDIECLLDELRSRVGFRLISRRSLVLSPTELQSPFSEYFSNATNKRVLRVNCYLTPPAAAEIKFQYLSKQEQWSVSEPSEVIEFSGCDFDKTCLRVGRFYFQNDQLIGDDLWPKREAFIQWADQIFRTTTKLLDRSKTLNAYLGEGAAVWLRNGGCFREI